MVGSTATLVSFLESSALLQELAGVEVNPKQVERAAEALGQEIAEDERQTVEPVSDAPLPSTLYLGIDGTGIPMRASELVGRSGKQEDGSAKTREVKLVTVWSAEAKDQEGIPVRDPGSVSYSAAIESAATHDTDPDYAEFTQRVQREAIRRGFPQAPRTAVLGDGAVYIWNIAGELFPEATQIVDRFHVKQHLSDVAKALYGPDRDNANSGLTSATRNSTRAAYTLSWKLCSSTLRTARRPANVAITSSATSIACAMRNSTRKAFAPPPE